MTGVQTCALPIFTFFYLNSYSFYLANKHVEFRNDLNKADYIIADGYSIVWLINKLYKTNIEKVVFTYSFFDNLANLFLERNTRIYLLGRDRKSTRLNSSHIPLSRMPSSA